MTSDDDLSRWLTEWAESGDPGDSALTGDDVRARGEGGSAGSVVADPAPSHRTRWLAAAAVLVIVLGGVTAWNLRADDALTRVTTAPDTTTGSPGAAAIPVQVIVDTRGVDVASDVGLWRYGMTDGYGNGLAQGALLAGATLIVDRPISVSRLTIDIEAYPCDATGCDPTATDQDGRPLPGSGLGPPFDCESVVDIGFRSTRALVRPQPEPGGTMLCPSQLVDDAPALTVAPGWSTREALPWACGTAARDAGTLVGPADPTGSALALECMAAKLQADERAELPTSEIQPTDDVRPAWWRIGGTDQRAPLEIIRAPGSADEPTAWSIQRCQELEHPPDSVFPSGCEPEEPLSLDLPPLDDAVIAPGTDPEDPRGVRLVVDAQGLAEGRDGSVHRWEIETAPRPDGDAAIGPAGPILTGATPQVALVAEGLRVDQLTGGDTVRWRRDDCEGSCPAVSSAGEPLDDSLPVNTCRATVPPLTGDDVVIFRLRGQSCSVTVADDLPALTVPPAWSLEYVSQTCGVDTSGPAGTAGDPAPPALGRVPRECLARAFAAGDSVELASVEATPAGPGSVTFRVSPRRVELFRPPPPDTRQDWTLQVCDGLATLDQAPWIEPTGCGQAEPLSLDPP